MRLSGKEFVVRQRVKRQFALRLHECSACGHFVKFERMYVVPEVKSGVFFFDCKLNRWLSNAVTARYCSECVESKEEAFDLTYKYNVTAQDVVQANQQRYMQKQMDDRQIELGAANDALNDMLKSILALPDGEVSPTVNGIILRYIKYTQ